MFETYRIGFYCKQKFLQIHVGAQSLKGKKTTPFLIAILSQVLQAYNQATFLPSAGSAELLGK